MCCVAIFQKTLRLSTTADGGVSKGEVVTLMSTDPVKIQDAVYGIFEIVCSPIDVVIYTAFLARILGFFPTLGVFFVIVIFACINAFSSSGFMKVCHVCQMFHWGFVCV